MNAIQKKRAELEQRRAVIDAQLALLAELDGDSPAELATPAPVPPPGKPLPRPKREPTERPAGSGDKPDGVRRKLLELMAAHPDGLKVSELSERLGVGDNIVSYNLKHEWFEKSDPSYVRSPWVLTEAGEKAAGELTRSAT